jgi:hypothetical protein
MSTSYTPFSDDDRAFQEAVALRQAPEGMAPPEPDEVTQELLQMDPSLSAQRDRIPEALRVKVSGVIAAGEGTGFSATGQAIRNSAAGMLPKSSGLRRNFDDDLAQFRKDNPHLYG